MIFGFFRKLIPNNNPFYNPVVSWSEDNNDVFLLSVTTNGFIGNGIRLNVDGVNVFTLDKTATSIQVGNSTVNSLFCTANGFVNNNLTVLGNTSCNTNLTVVGNATVDTNLTVSGNAAVNTNLTVSGNATINTNLVVSGNATINTNLTVVGNATFANVSFVNTNTTNLVANTILYVDSRSTKTANYTILSTESNKHFDNIGAAGEVDFTLPTPTSGLMYGFYVGTAQTLKVIAVANATIRVAASVSASNGNITNATVGGYIEITAVNAVSWVAKYSTGTWTVT